MAKTSDESSYHLIRQKLIDLLGGFFEISVDIEKWSPSQIPLLFRSVAVFFNVILKRIDLDRMNETEEKSIRVAFIPDIDRIGYPAVLTFICNLQQRLPDEYIVLGTDHLTYNRVSAVNEIYR